MAVSAFFREFDASSGGSLATIRHQHAAQSEEAYAKGVEDGLARARTEIAGQTVTAMEALTARLEDIGALQESMKADVASEAGLALSALVRSLCPGLAALGLADRARELLENELCDAPRPLSIGAAPEVAESLKSLYAEFTVESDEDMPVTRIDIAWPEGGATVDTEALVSRIMELADTLDLDCDTPDQDTPEQDTPEQDTVETPHD